MSGIIQGLMASIGGKTEPIIGSSYEGGYYAGKISTAGNGIADYYLVVSPPSSGESSSKQWKTSGGSSSGTQSVIDGPTNSANMNDASHPAAQFCEGLTIGGFSDWYFPAKNELEVCYYNLKPGTTSNNTSTGTNTNAVPSRNSNYTSSVPGQTSAADFKDTGAQKFSNNFYWSSTESTANRGSRQSFANGYQYTSLKYNYYWVRATRRVAI